MAGITVWTSILTDAAVVLFFLVGLVAAAIGLMLLLSPEAFERVNKAASRRFSARQAMKPLEQPRYHEPFFYRHHGWTGGLILAGALFFLLSLLFRFTPEMAAAALPGVDWIWIAVIWILITGNVFAVAVALVILLRPSALKPLEAAANRWISLRRASRPLDRTHEGPDRLVHSYPRASGLVLVLAGLFLMVTFGLLIFN